jgi:hypothetical protein
LIELFAPFVFRTVKLLFPDLGGESLFERELSYPLALFQFAAVQPEQEQICHHRQYDVV